MARFSKRHYEALAESFAIARARADSLNHHAPTEVLYGIGYAQAEVTAMLANDNPQFDGERFARASGMRGS